MVALDLPGFGLSPMPTEPISMPAYGDLILSFADAVGLGPETFLVGHSMGGFISTEAVTSDPDRFSQTQPDLRGRNQLREDLRLPQDR